MDVAVFSQSLVILQIRSLFSGAYVHIVMGAFRKRYIVLIQDSGKAVDWGAHEMANEGRKLFVKPDRLLEMLQKFIRDFGLSSMVGPIS